ncbi:MAG: hypothetical protein J2P31_02695 [Blastocatellia bacterium]|nr:hypothetical protein [Blastocatellia bacterium]
MKAADFMKFRIKNTALLSVSLLVTSMAYSSLSASPVYHVDHSYQQSLPVDKQKSLATYGPEDVFPTQSDDKPPRNQRTRRTRQGAAARSVINPASNATPDPAEQRQTNSTVEPSPLPTPTVTPTAAVSNLTQDEPSPQPSPRVSVQILGILIFLVTTALIFVVFKLMTIFREGSG